MPAADPASSLATALTDVARLATITSWTTPRDAASHRARLAEFLESGDADHYPTPFDYDPVETGPLEAAVRRAEHALEALTDSPFRDVVAANLADTLGQARLLSVRDGDRISADERRRRGTLAPQTLARAEAALTQPAAHDPEVPTIADADLADAVTRQLAALGLDGWRVVIDEKMAARMSVTGTKRLLKVRAGVTVTPAQARRLLVHEVGGHVVRWENAWAQPNPLAAVPLGEASSTEEGLAVALEADHGVQSPEQLRVYAGRALAVHWAGEAGIVEVARRLRPWLGVEVAVEIALRVKRGLRDPNRAGGLARDQGYFAGLLAVQALNPRDVELLRGVKWATDLLPLAREADADGLLVRPTLQLRELVDVGS